MKSYVPEISDTGTRQSCATFCQFSEIYSYNCQRYRYLNMIYKNVSLPTGENDQICTGGKSMKKEDIYTIFGTQELECHFVNSANFLKNS